jgi:peptidoglycan/xylan/chitin deacetylase (PgdA/CDA1 family)/TolA-binding protein
VEAFLKITKPAGIAAICLFIAAAIFFSVLYRRTAQESKNTPGSAADEISALQKDLALSVDNYRKIIVLLEDEKSLTQAWREAANLIGIDLFYANQKLLAPLGEMLPSEIEEAGQRNKGLPPKTAFFLNELENQAEWHDADKLVFRDVLEELMGAAEALPDLYSQKALLIGRIADDLKALKEIQSLYDREMQKIFGRFETRGMTVRREAWNAYVAYLKTKITRDDIFKEYKDKLSLPPAGNEPVAQKEDKDAKTVELPAKSLVLTFDDGPHYRYTPRIMEVLKRKGVKGVFFELGSNIGSFGKDNSIHRTKASKVSEEVAKAGFYLANHSYSHAYLPKLGDAELKSEIERTNRLLAQVTDMPVNLFRPPYGAQNKKILDTLGALNMRSLLWHIDSRDWADPVPTSIADRVVREVTRNGRGVILFHDINARTVEALPLIIDTLKNDGYDFLAWNGKAFVNESRGGNTAAISGQVPEDRSLYRESWAVVIGIDKYAKWPPLQYAVNDAKGIKELLIRKYRFKEENIITLLDQEATRERILSALGDEMGNADKVKKDDRVFIFFAGHGVTRKLASGRDLGYIIPVDADLQNYQGKAISMTNFQDISEAIAAKHLFYVMDSCYSGLALTRGAAGRSDNFLREVSRRVARQMLTAGGADEQVADNGPHGHSVFTWTLLQGLEGRADLNNDGAITASELAAYVGPAVSGVSKQTPAFGSLAGSEGGEFIFDPKENAEFLSELSMQLDHEAISLNNQIEQIRKQIAEKRQRNRRLQQELAAVMNDAALRGNPVTGSQLDFAKHMRRGDELYKERKYEEASKEFLAASKINVSSALAANNAGFTYFKMGQFENAIGWFEKAIALDPKRAVAYGNLGDAYLNLNRKVEAKRAFQKCLELAPNSKDAAAITEKMAGL